MGFLGNETLADDFMEVLPKEANPFDLMEFIQTKEFLFFCVVGLVILVSLLVMCVVCVSNAKRKGVGSPVGYNRAATQVEYLIFQKWVGDFK